MKEKREAFSEFSFNFFGFSNRIYLDDMFDLTKKRDFTI